MSENHQIKIHETLYVGFQRNSSVTGSMPVAIITPYLTTKAGEKNRIIIDQWSKGNNGGKEPLNSITVENKAMIGFRISRAQRNTGWHLTADAIRVEDPRGFEVPITLANMIMLTDNNLLENGEIMRECIWGRDGNTNVLLPVNSVPYQQAFTNTERLKTHVDVRKLQRGDHVVLKNGIVGRYLGKLHAISENHDGTRYSYNYENTKHYFSTTAEKPIHYVQVKIDTAQGMPQKYKYMGFASPNVSRVEKSEPMTAEEVNQLLVDEYMAGMKQEGGKYNVIMLFTDAVTLTGELVEIDQQSLLNNAAKPYKLGRWGATLSNKFYGKPKYDHVCEHIAMNYQAIRSGVFPGLIAYQKVSFIADDRTSMMMSGEYKAASMDSNQIDYLQLQLTIKVDATGQTFTVQV